MDRFQTGYVLRKWGMRIYMAATKGKNLENIQQMNRTLVLKLLQQNKICARSELSKQSGLKQATITNIINDFIAWGIVEEIGFLEGMRGRRSIAVTLERKRHCVAAVRISRRYFMVGLVDFLGEEVSKPYKENVSGQAPEMIIAKIKRTIKRVIAENDKIISAIGVAVPGPYFYKEGEIGIITDAPGWEKVSIKKELEQDFSIPVVVDHDANAGVLAECSFRETKFSNDTIIYLAVGQGIGAGISYHGRIIRGSLGIAGEVGHASINANGIKCECGNRGCLTLYASSRAFMEQAERERSSGKKTMLKEGFTLDELIEATVERDKMAYSVFKKIVYYLSVGIINIIYIYNPHTLIIGDEMAAIGPLLIDEIMQNVDKLKSKRIAENVNVRLSSFQPDPAYIGASAVAIDHLFKNTELFDSAEERSAK